jgi:alkane 1-monooxygenase
MLQAAPHAIGFVLPLAIVVGAGLGGAWTFLPLALVYLLVPALDAAVGLNPESPDGDEALALGANAWFRLLTWIWVPVQLALIGWAIGWVAGASASPLECAGVTLSLGITCGAIGLTFAHELVHRRGRWERGLGEVLLSSVSYPHFAIEHVFGHHRYVATPRDSATARFGESLYRFLPRTIGGGLASAWRLERSRLLKRGRSMGSLHNRFIRYGVTQAVIYVSLWAAWGAAGVLAFVAQALVAVALLETINYVEHYGLIRRELAPGRYEPVAPAHSWNSCHRLSNWILINLARHADHHLVASKRYQVLDHLGEAPQLPAGYASMLMLAMVPPLWRRVMDPRVLAWREQQ